MKVPERLSRAGLIAGASGVALLAALVIEYPGTSAFLWYLLFIPAILAAYCYHQWGIAFSAALGIGYLGIASLRAYPDMTQIVPALLPFVAMIALASLVSVVGYSVQEQQIRDREAIDRIPFGAFLVRRSNFTIAGANEKFCAILGYSGDELQDLPVSRIWPYSDDRKEFFARIASTGGYTETETRFHGRNGEVHWLYLAGRCLNDSFISCQIFDITLAKNAEAESIAERKRLISVLNALPAYVALLTPDHTIRFANRTFRQIFGDPDGRHCYEVLHGYRVPCSPCRGFLVFDLQSPQHWEWEHLDGRTYDTFAYPFTDVDGTHLMLQLGIDVTQRKQAEEALKVYARNLQMKNQELDVLRRQLFVVNEDLDAMVRERTADVEKLLKQKDEFISQLGHDLKTPLTPLVALLPRIVKQEQDPKQKKLLDIVQRNVTYMKDLVTKTLKLARLNSLYFELELENVPLRSEVDHLIQNYAYMLKERAIAIENRVPERIVVQADRVLLAEIFDNLITNAVKYTREGGGTIVVDAERERDTVTVSVRDSGVGMTAEQLDQVFNEFYKADPSRHDLDSSGLGLAICKRIVERHGGEIWAESAGPGEGSTILFTLKASGGI